MTFDHDVNPVRVTVPGGVDDRLAGDAHDVLALSGVVLARARPGAIRLDLDSHIDLKALRELVRHRAKRPIHRRRPRSRQIPDGTTRNSKRMAGRDRKGMLGARLGVQGLSVKRDQRKILGQAIVEVAGNPLPLGCERCLRRLVPHRHGRAQCSREQNRVGRQPQSVVRSHPVRGDDGHGHELDLRGGEEEGCYGEKTCILVSSRGTQEEPYPGDNERDAGAERNRDHDRVRVSGCELGRAHLAADRARAHDGFKQSSNQRDADACDASQGDRPSDPTRDGLAWRKAAAMNATATSACMAS